MPQRSPPFSGAETRLQPHSQILPSPANSFLQGDTGRKLGGNRCAQRASRAVRIFRENPPVFKERELPFIKENIRYGILAES